MARNEAVRRGADWTLYSCADAPNARRVEAFLALKGLAPRVVQVDPRKGATREPWFLAKNPFMTIPVLEIEPGLCISETLAICEYVEAERARPALMGVGASERARVAEWHERVEQRVLYVSATAVLHLAPESRFGSFAQGMPRDHRVGEAARLALARAYARLERRLRESPYLAADHVTIADLSAAVTIEPAATIGLGIANEQPGLRRWYESLLAQPCGVHLRTSGGVDVAPA